MVFLIDLESGRYDISEDVEMRRQLIEIYWLHRAAVRNCYRDDARKLDNAWNWKEITAKELIDKLRELVKS